VKTSARIRAGVLFAAIVVVAAACSSSDEGESAGSDETTTTTTQAAAAADSTTTTTVVATTTTTVPETTTTTEAPLPDLTLTTSSFPTLSGGAHYEGWAIVDGEPISTGKFNVEGDRLTDAGGVPIDGFFLSNDVGAASTIVITIEPAGDTDAVPADTHFVAGDIVAGEAELTIAHPAALGTDFADASGSFVLATPTDGDRTNDELSGIWFLEFPGPEASLNLPELPEGWTYEGWAVIDGVPVTSGTFRSTVGSDDSAPYSGTVRTPNFPGEDYLFNAPEGLTFPTDLSGAPVVVSVEPVPDDDPSPFVLKPLVGAAGDPAEPEPVAYELLPGPEAPPTALATITG
jgi:hypothetical protein